MSQGVRYRRPDKCRFRSSNYDRSFSISYNGLIILVNVEAAPEGGVAAEESDATVTLGPNPLQRAALQHARGSSLEGMS
jgi:hypothetical protein